MRGPRLSTIKLFQAQVSAVPLGTEICAGTVAHWEAAIGTQVAAAASTWASSSSKPHSRHADGMQAAKALRTEGFAGSIVALTADAFEDDRRACLAAGMDDFLTKPLEIGALRTILAKWGVRVWTPAARRDKLVS